MVTRQSTVLNPATQNAILPELGVKWECLGKHGNILISKLALTNNI